ncbi:hypothetical protein AB0O01_17470 [Streptomyces sp. NPDC093252]|uniref:hypothetical protein n=1 Tax=Streptomyces sp. NPDC093252 TaxID=3154980 RepID=UPI00341B2CA0
MTAPVRDILTEALSLLVLPSLPVLSDEQVRGEVCVWNPAEARLSAETAVDLGERKDGGRRWFPRACRTHTGLTAYRALLDHAPTCEQCVDNHTGCPIGRPLARLTRLYHRAAGQ